MEGRRRILQSSRRADRHFVRHRVGTRDARGFWTADQAQRRLDYTRLLGGRIAAAEWINEPTLAGMGGDNASFMKQIGLAK